MGVFNQFPSFRQVQDGAIRVVQRFPFTMTAAIVGSIAAMVLVENERNLFAQRLLLSSALGVPLFTALVSFAEMRAWPAARKVLLQAIGLALLVAYFFTMRDNPFEPHFTAMRFLLLFIGLHFLAAFLPFWDRERAAGFWAFNKALFLRFLFAALYSAVLFTGLAIALAAADNLFGADVPPARYGQLWMAITGIFNTWIFLAGVPSSLEKLKAAGEYPKGLKVFTQFILLPLVGLYFLILIAYELKIIIEWQWPFGWVSQLVLWYAVLGILSLLLLHPLREKSDSTWIQVFSRWYFRAIVPLVVMLFLAILVRIGDYGWTPPRYFVFAMAIGLAVVVLYFIFSKAKDIRIIPIVLCALAFLAAYGPWSAFDLSLRSQLGRLDVYLTADNAQENAVTKVEGDVYGRGEQQNASSIVSYLVDWHGVEPFEDMLSDSVYAVVDTMSTYTAKEEIASALGFEYSYSIGSEFDNGYFSFSTESPRPNNKTTGYLIDIDAYQYELDLTAMSRIDVSVEYNNDSTILFARYEDTGTLDIYRFSDTLPPIVSVDVRPLIDSLVTKDNVRELKRGVMTVVAESSQAGARLLIDNVSGYDKDGKLEFVNANGRLLLRLYQ